VEKLQEIFPNKIIQLRTPMHKELLYGDSTTYAQLSNTAKITQERAFTSEPIAHIGFHNDCFLANDDDEGTYADNNITFWKNYLQNDARYTPLGGETCKDTQEFTHCSYALKELQTLHFTFLNHSFDEDVIERWKAEGCYDEIAQNLGYNLVAKQIDTNLTTNSLKVDFQLFNKGYASVFNPYEISWILQNQENNSTQEFLDNTLDIRTFTPQQRHTLTTTLNTQDIQEGIYCLYIKFQFNNDVIQLSNKAMFDTNLQANRLLCDINITH
jgi:hypothetical protein